LTGVEFRSQISGRAAARRQVAAMHASGGELSRFLLALKVPLTGQQSGLTLIFDEIDRGVGGATARAL